MIDYEQRAVTGLVETRGADSWTVGGYALKWNKQSRNLGGFVEQIADTSLNKSRGDGWPGVMARYNHDDNMLLGTINGGTLRLNPDNVGLAYEVDLPQTRADVRELVQRRDVNHSSFAFVAVDDEWGLNDLDIPLRTVRAMKLIDVAPVTDPAYWDTSVQPRQMAYDSLARQMHADPAEVRQLAERNELRKMFRRTDPDGGPSGRQTSFGPSARMAILGRAQDPWA